MDYRGEADQSRIAAQAELFEEDLEAALGSSMRVLSAGGIKRVRTVLVRGRENLIVWHIQDVSGRIDESPNEPRARYSVRLGSLACDPFHPQSSPIQPMS